MRDAVIALLMFFAASVACQEQFAIHVINTPPDADELQLLPLVGSQEYQDARRARELEEERYVDSSSASEEGQTAYEAALRLLDNSPKDRKLIYQHLEFAAWEGHTEAQEVVAMAYLTGKTLPLNISGAKDLYQMLQAKGHAAGQMGLGFLYSTGLGMEAPSQPMALLHYTFAALGGNSFAQMALGYRYFTGVNVENNCEQALYFYRKVASKVADHIPLTGGKALQKIRLYEEWENPAVNTNMDDDLMQYYTYVAEKGDNQAQVILGQLYLQGSRGLPQDRALAHQYFSKAAAADSPSAHAHLGRMYLEGSPEVRQSNATAFTHFTAAAEAKNGMGHSGLGLMYLYGRGVAVDYALAVKHFKAAVEANSVDGQVQLGIMLFHGLGVERDLTKSIKMLTAASQSGSVVALFYLAEINAMGFGVPRNCRSAAELYKNVAERGKWGTLFADAFNDYKMGRLDTSLVRYLLLADLGYEVAQSNVAFILDKAEDSVFPSNETYRRALVYWDRSAAQGHALARLKLGDYHYYGMGTEVDYEAAVNNYRQAESAPSPQALFNLGYMHQRGYGVKQDLHLAKRFYDRALETSADAYAPVALALISVGVMYAWQQFLSFFGGSSVPENSTLPDFIMNLLLEDWDVLLAVVLFIVLVIVMIILQRLTMELQRQRLLRRGLAAAAPVQNAAPAQNQAPLPHLIPDPVQE
ncbi:Protein sel-1-like protein 1 [Hypsibius exemplaris]|uniref:Protein sel-1-like protein 1 n=1 Tax=Hypsibius exemplaris TaxID=2072580 RepID=A0A1W0WTG4_HYPEX|nr:Protein sel-1-like protein 1 [Hypsibius exemplaris]